MYVQVPSEHCIGLLKIIPPFCVIQSNVRGRVGARVTSLIKSIRCRILRLYIFKKKKVNDSVSTDLDVKTMTFGEKVGGGGWGASSDPYP